MEKKSTGSALQVDQDASLHPCCWLLTTRERWEAQVQPCVWRFLCIALQSFLLGRGRLPACLSTLPLLSMYKPLHLGFGFHYTSEATIYQSFRHSLCLEEIVRTVLLNSLKFHGCYLCVCIGARSIPSVLASLRAVTES